VLFGRELHIHFPLLMQYLNNFNVNMEISMFFFEKKKENLNIHASSFQFARYKNHSS
jgi:hypothetical protein